MSRKKKSPAAPIVPPAKKSGEAGSMLVNNLSVADARHLLQTEGGELGASQIVVQVIQIAAVAGACAYAIWVGEATAWHLVLPMVGEYLILLAILPVLYLFLRHQAMRKDTIGSLRLWAIFALINAGAVAYQSHRSGIPWLQQFLLNIQQAWAWITDHHMHWAILFAMAGVLLGLPGRIRNLYEYGPPFVAVGLGCGMRVAVFFLGCFLLPFIASGTQVSNAWILWALLLIAEILALGMHLDIQRRLKKLDAEVEPEAMTN